MYEELSERYLTLLIIPAVDIKGGKCVRLEQGLMDRETLFSERPEQMALQWEKKGAKRLHLIDLDGAFQGAPVNKEIIKNIVNTLSIPVELGGGIRSLETIEEYLNLGVADVIMGTTAFKNPNLVKMACERYPGRILLGIDSKNGYVSIEGWTEATKITAIDMAKRCEGLGVRSFIFTDIKRDGMKAGPNIEAIKRFSEATNIPVIVAGGISSLKDIENLLKLEKNGVSGVIIGRALYDGSVKLEHILSIVAKK